MLITLFSQLALAEGLPPDAKLFVEKLPNKTLSLDVILIESMRNADNYKRVEAEAAKIPVRKLQAEALFDTQLSASVGQADSKNESASPFGTKRYQKDTYEVTLSKYFTTGTSLELSASQNWNNSDYPSSSSLVSSANQEYYETIGSLSFSQNLWKDSFGYSSRRKLKAGALGSKAQMHLAHEALDAWSLDLVNRYYKAWMSQRQGEVAYENLARKNRLLKATKARARRGTAVQSDRLQVEAVHLLAKNQVDEVQNLMEDQWRELVLLVKLPSAWINIDPKYVPLSLDDTPAMASQLCEALRKEGIRHEPPSVQKNKYLAQSAQLLGEAASNELSPSLSLVGSYTVNGVDRNRADSNSQSLDQDFPAWSIGLELSMPLGFSSEKAELVDKQASALAASAVYLDSKANARVDWLNSCAQLDRLKNNIQIAEQAYRKQLQRQKLEEKRFRIGRVPALNTIQAGDDAADAELNWQHSKVNIRLTSWRILSLAGKVPEILKHFGKELDKQYQHIERPNQ